MKKLLVLLPFAAVVYGLLTGAGLEIADQVFASLLPERVVEVPIDRPVSDIRELIQTIPPRYGVSPLLAAAIVERESGGKKDAIRFEQSQMARAKKITNDPEQQRMYASSHCAFQVMGWHAPRFGLSWADLYAPDTCAEVAMTILKDCLDKHQGREKVAQIVAALECYNGSREYAQAVRQRLGDLLIEQTL
jgi:soluble lytic murein transglycosylase-like protein